MEDHEGRGILNVCLPACLQYEILEAVLPLGVHLMASAVQGVIQDWLVQFLKQID